MRVCRSRPTRSRSTHPIDPSLRSSHRTFGRTKKLLAADAKRTPRSPKAVNLSAITDHKAAEEPSWTRQTSTYHLVVAKIIQFLHITNIMIGGEEEVTSAYSIAQRKALSITPHVTGLISFFASAFIVIEILRDRLKRSQIYHRLMLGMSIITMLSSIFFGLSTWPIPEETPYVYDARGNTRTCTAQGFFLALSFVAPMYSVVLSAYYLLVIGYSRKERELRKLERFAHIFVTSTGLAFAVSGLALDLYNSVQLWCFIGPIPCDDNDPECDPNANKFQLYRWIFVGIPLWICIFAITGLMAAVLFKVYNQERRSRKWRAGAENKGRQLTKKVAEQAAWYVSSFYITWLIPTISRAMSAFGKQPPFALMFLTVLMIPLQGAFNFVIYMRPRYVKFRRNNPDRSTLGLLMETFLRTCKIRREEEDGDDMNLALKVGNLYQTTAASMLHSVVVSRASAVQPHTSKAMTSSAVVPVQDDGDGAVEGEMDGNTVMFKEGM